MVFGGPGVTLNYEYAQGNHFWYRVELGSHITFNRGIVGISVHLKPVDVYYGWDVSKRASTVTIGSRFKTDYSIQLYPDLQSGLNFWFTDFSLAPNIIYQSKIDNDVIKLQTSVNIINFTSRTPTNRNPHFFSLNVGDILSDAHSKMKFGSIFNSFSIDSSVEYHFYQSNWSLGYYFRYTNYSNTPTFRSLNHDFNIKYTFGE